MKYYYLLLIIPLFCSCFNKEKKDAQKESNLKGLEKSDTVSFNDLILEIEENNGFLIKILNKNGKDKMQFSLKDTFKIKIEYSPQSLNDKNYKYSIKPISKGFILIRSLSPNIFLATINDLDVNDQDEVYSVFDVFIESNDVFFKVEDRRVKDGKKPIYYYSNKEIISERIIKFKIDT